MTSSLKTFSPSESNEVKNLLLYAIICSLITPCMVGITLSQELNRWPIGEASFKLWWRRLHRAKASTISIRYSAEDSKQKIWGEERGGGSAGLRCKTVGSKVDHFGITLITSTYSSHCSTSKCIYIHTKRTTCSTSPLFKSWLSGLNIVPEPVSPRRGSCQDTDRKQKGDSNNRSDTCSEVHY